MGQSFPTTNTGSGGDNFKTGIDNHETRTDTLRSCFSGSSAPGSPVVGQLWIDTSATPNLLKQYGDIGAGNAWNVIGPVARLNHALVGDASASDTRATVNELKGWKFENRGAHVSAGAGNIGYFYLLTGDGEVYYLENTVAGARKALLSILPSTSYDAIDLDIMGTTGFGATPPTAWNAGTSPAARGLLFDAVGESLTLEAIVPKNFSDDGDLILETTWVLDSAETAGDDIEVDCNWVAVTRGTDAVNKTSTAAPTAATDIGAVTGQYSAFKVQTTIDYDDASNPVDAGDLLIMEINRKTVGGAGFVAGAALVGARLLYPQKARMERG